MRRGSQVFIFWRQVTRTLNKYISSRLCGSRYINVRVQTGGFINKDPESLALVCTFNKKKTLVVKAFSEYYENITKFRGQLYLRMYLICGAAIAGLLLVVPQSNEVWHYGQLGGGARAATVHTAHVMQDCDWSRGAHT